MKYKPDPARFASFKASSTAAMVGVATGLAVLMSGFSSSIVSGSAHAAIKLPDGVSCGLALGAVFREGAPVDRFTITNKSTAQWAITSVTLNLAQSAGKLIFDTQNGGDGVEVSQPFREAGGNAKLRSSPKVNDGDPQLVLDFEAFDSQQSFTFSIDVDDTLKASELGQIRVSGSEIKGASLSYTLRGPNGKITSAEAEFGTNAKSDLSGKSC